MQVSVKIKDYDKLVKAFNKAPKEVVKRTERAVAQSVFLVESNAKKLAPVNKQSGGGNLRQSIRAIPKGTTGLVDVGAKYAVPVHEGTRPHIIRAKAKKVLADRRNGKFFGKVVNHPGTKAQPFLREAVEKSNRRINNFFSEIFKGIIKL